MVYRLPRYPHVHCYHEAGHAVAFWYYDIRLESVTINSADISHSGEVVVADRQVVGITQMEQEMHCAVAGEIAQRAKTPFSRELSDESLVRCFQRDAHAVLADEALSVNDGRNFAKIALERDKELRQAMPDAPIGPESWRPVFREAEHLIREELWPAVQEVAEELCRGTGDLSNDDVNTLASRHSTRWAGNH